MFGRSTRKFLLIPQSADQGSMFRYLCVQPGVPSGPPGVNVAFVLGEPFIQREFVKAPVGVQVILYELLVHRPVTPSHRPQAGVK